MAEVRAHSPLTLRPVHPPKVEKRATKPSIARHVNIRVNDPLDHDAPAILHEPRSYNFNESKGSAVVLVFTRRSQTSWPFYSVSRLSEYCSADIVASFTYLREHFNSTTFVLIGWSFGGSPCFTVAAQDDRVRGVATVASQTANTVGIKRFEEYGNTGPREIRLLPGNDHGLTRHSTEVEKMIFEFAAKTLGFEKLLDQSSDQAGEDLIESRDERIREMVEGHDLEGDERLQ
ncbi:hypothetical protein KXW20_006147 [Aspergillus fumigatus]|nr:hypothetical protein KXW20_006147 [Aspergillus fumigatus]